MPFYFKNPRGIIFQKSALGFYRFRLELFLLIQKKLKKSKANLFSVRLGCDYSYWEKIRIICADKGNYYPPPLYYIYIILPYIPYR